VDGENLQNWVVGRRRKGVVMGCVRKGLGRGNKKIGEKKDEVFAVSGAWEKKEMGVQLKKVGHDHVRGL
jgi:hypothetical protein